MKTVILESAESHIGYNNNRPPKKPWITSGMIEKMDQRRRWKSVNTEVGRKKYKQLNNDLRRETEKAREVYWDTACTELEELEKRNRADLVYAKVKQLTSKKGNNNSVAAIKSSNGEVLTDGNEIKTRWKEYIETLYDKNGKPTVEEMGIEKEESNLQEDCVGPEILECEVRAAVKELKNGKAVGADGVPGEFLKALGEEGMKKIVELCQKIYNEGV